MFYRFDEEVFHEPDDEAAKQHVKNCFDSMVQFVLYRLTEVSRRQ
jgi:hypothetical protein